MEKQVSKPKQGAVITTIPDIGDVVDDDLPLDTTTLHGVEVAGVQSLVCYPACFACNAKVNSTQ